jgi:MFS family permease
MSSHLLFYILFDKHNLIPSHMDYLNNPTGIAQRAIGSILTGGSVNGSIIAGFIFDKLGRCKALAFACIWWLLGTSLQVVTNGRAMLISGRALNRIRVGIISF